MVRSNTAEIDPWGGAGLSSVGQWHDHPPFCLSRLLLWLVLLWLQLRFLPRRLRLRLLRLFPRIQRGLHYLS
jgi:hypothetical protein